MKHWSKARAQWLLMAGLIVGCSDDSGGDGDSGALSSGTSAGSGTAAAATSGSADSTSSPADDTTAGPPLLPARLAVTADWQARTLSVVDLDALAAGATTYDAAVAITVDLSPYAPGPLQVELAPDGTTAVVSISPGFFGGFVGGVIGATDVEQDGTLLVVDLATEEITEVATAHVPMGIAITPDGSRAFTANYGLDDPQGSTLSVIDLPGRTLLEDIEVGPRPEQVSLSDDGSLGALNVVGLGAIRVFEVADPAGTLSEPLEIGNDPSDVAFIPGTSWLVATNSLDPSNYVVIDVADPSAPVQAEVGPPPLGSFYGVTHVPDTSDVLLTATDFSSIYLFRVTIGPDGTPTEQWQTSRAVGSFPMGVAVDPIAELALVATPGDDTLTVFGLDGTLHAAIDWPGDGRGPTYAAVAP